MIDSDDLSYEILYNSLVNLGNIYMLEGIFDPMGVRDTLVQYSEHWHPYNPRKNHIARFGMSLTSLDGGLSGTPDLDSLYEYNKINNTNYKEEDFKVPTKILLDHDLVNEPIKRFIPHLGRSHFIKLGEGGYFPFHRDAQQIGAKTFRIICPLLGCDTSQFCFLYNGKRIFLEVGHVYFMNTKIEHALMSFGESTIMVLNVIVSKESVQLVIDSLQSR